MMDFMAALSAAKDTKDPEDYISRVKNVLRDELKLVDPKASIEDTQYFCHSAIPDFVITWPREKSQRSIFLRDNLQNVVAARDAEFIPSDAPAVITLDDAKQGGSVVRELAAQMEKNPNALITSASTLDVMDDKTLSENSPVSQLVRTNFIRGAKGWIDAAEAELLLGGGSTTSSPQQDAVQEAIQRHFQSDAATRISRAAHILGLAGSAEWSEQLDNDELFAGHLSEGELRSILPWLLREQPLATSGFWKKFGSMFEFSELEKLYSELKGFDLTALIESNKDTWGVKRAYAGLLVEDETPDTEDSYSDEYKWAFVGRTISKSLPSQGSRVHVAHSGTKLPGRGAATSKTWESLEPTLFSYKLVRVELKGLRRSVTINAEESDDIRQDISEVTNSLEDTYYVQSVTVTTDSTEEGTTETQIDFGKSLAVSDGDTTLDALTKAVENILVGSGQTVVDISVKDSEPYRYVKDSEPYEKK